jgi:hypothetical protein
VAEVWVGNVDTGFVQADQKARVKLAAYPFQKYGVLDGVVKQVSADAHENPELGNPAGKSVQDAAYRALINLEQKGVRAEISCDEDVRHGAGEWRSFDALSLLGDGSSGGAFGHAGSIGSTHGMVNLKTLPGLEEGFHWLRT